MSSEMHLEAVIEPVWRFTWRSQSYEFGDALGGRDYARWRCTWRPCWGELGGRNRVSLEIHLEAVIEPVWKCTWRP